MGIALSRGAPVRFKSARIVFVAHEGRGLHDKLNRMGIAEVCCVREMAAAQTLCDAGDIDACLFVLPRALPDDRPDWDASTPAPGRGRIPSLLMVEATTPYIQRSAAEAGYYAVSPCAISARVLYRCIAALLQGGRQPADVPGEQASEPRPRMRRLGGGVLGGENVISGKPKLQ